MERDGGGRLAIEHAHGELGGGDAAVVEVTGDGQHGAIIGLTGSKTHEWQPGPAGDLGDAGEARARQIVGNLADRLHPAAAQGESGLGDLAAGADPDDFDLDPHGLGHAQ